MESFNGTLTDFKNTMKLREAFELVGNVLTDLQHIFYTTHYLPHMETFDDVLLSGDVLIHGTISLKSVSYSMRSGDFKNMTVSVSDPAGFAPRGTRAPGEDAVVVNERRLAFLLGVMIFELVEMPDALRANFSPKNGAFLDKKMLDNFIKLKDYFVSTNSETTFTRKYPTASKPRRGQRFDGNSNTYFMDKLFHLLSFAEKNTFSAICDVFDQFNMQGKRFRGNISNDDPRKFDAKRESQEFMFLDLNRATAMPHGKDVKHWTPWDPRFAFDTHERARGALDSGYYVTRRDGQNRFFPARCRCECNCMRYRAPPSVAPDGTAVPSQQFQIVGSAGDTLYEYSASKNKNKYKRWFIVCDLCSRNFRNDAGSVSRSCSGPPNYTGGRADVAGYQQNWPREKGGYLPLESWEPPDALAFVLANTQVYEALKLNTHYQLPENIFLQNFMSECRRPKNESLKYNDGTFKQEEAIEQENEMEEADVAYEYSLDFTITEVGIDNDDDTADHPEEEQDDDDDDGGGEGAGDAVPPSAAAAAQAALMPPPAPRAKRVHIKDEDEEPDDTESKNVQNIDFAMPSGGIVFEFKGHAAGGDEERVDAAEDEEAADEFGSPDRDDRDDPGGIADFLNTTQR